MLVWISENAVGLGWEQSLDIHQGRTSGGLDAAEHTLDMVPVHRCKISAVLVKSCSAEVVIGQTAVVETGKGTLQCSSRHGGRMITLRTFEWLHLGLTRGDERGLP